MTMREIRKSLGLTQKEFGKKYGIPRRTIEDWDRGIKAPTHYWVEIFVKLLKYERLYGELNDTDIQSDVSTEQQANNEVV